MVPELYEVLNWGKREKAVVSRVERPRVLVYCRRITEVRILCQKLRVVGVRSTLLQDWW